MIVFKRKNLSWGWMQNFYNQNFRRTVPRPLTCGGNKFISSKNILVEGKDKIIPKRIWTHFDF